MVAAVVNVLQNTQPQSDADGALVLGFVIVFFLVLAITLAVTKGGDPPQE